MSFNVFATVTITGNDYRIHFWLRSKDVAVNRMKNSDLVKKVDECKKKKIRRKKKTKKDVSSIIKMTRKDYKKWLVTDTKSYLKKKEEKIDIE